MSSSTSIIGVRAVSSGKILDKSSGAGLPAERIPEQRVLNVVHQDWGTATIFDMKPPPPPPPVAPPPEIPKIVRRSVYAAKSDEATKQVMNEFDNDDDEFWALPFFQSSMVATILEETATKLRILGECNNDTKISKAIADMPILLRLKYSVKENPIKDELDGIDPKKLGCTIYKINKLLADRERVLNLVLKLYVELSLEKTFTKLIDFISAVQDQQEYDLFIREEEARNKILRKELAKQLRMQRNHHKTVTYDTDNIIATLKSELEDSELLSETKMRYVGNWQAARTEQHELVIYQTEDELTSSAFYFKRRTDHEARVHSEVESLTNIVITDTLNDIENWMDKYDTDVEKIDLSIQIQKSHYQNKLDKRIELEALFAKRAKEMKEWNQFKEERDKERKYTETMNKSAITVQAWWRGLLVRKQLGPFKKKKKKKGK